MSDAHFLVLDIWISIPIEINAIDPRDNFKLIRSIRNPGRRTPLGISAAAAVATRANVVKIKVEHFLLVDIFIPIIFLS